MSLGLREYARHRKKAGLSGGTLGAVQAARDSGRLHKSLTKTGRIRSAEIADAEWASTTHEDRIPLTGRTAVAPSATERTAASMLQKNRARREAALADLAEIEVAEKREEFVPVDEVRAYVISRFTVVKTRLLGVPSGVAQRLPNLAAEIVPVIESLIREALEELADGSGDRAIAFLAGVLLEGAIDRDSFVERIIARLRESAPRHDANATTLATSELLVRELVRDDGDDDEGRDEDEDEDS